MAISLKHSMTVLLVWVLCAWPGLIVSAEEPSLPGPQSDFERALEKIGKQTDRTQSYSGLCQRTREYISRYGRVEDAILSKFGTANDAETLHALMTFCQTGDLTLGSAPKQNTCEKTLQLAPRHLALIRNLGMIRSEIGWIILLCVSTESRILLQNISASKVLIESSTMSRLRLEGVKLSNELIVSRTHISDALFVDNSDIANFVKLGPENAFGRTGRRLASLIFANTRVGGRFELSRSSNYKQVLFDGNRFGSDFHLRNSPFSERVIVRNNQFGGDVSVTKSQFEDNFAFENNVVARDLLIRGESTIAQTLNLFGSRMGVLRIWNTKIGRSLKAISARIDETAYLGPKLKVDHTLALGKVEAKEVRIEDSEFQWLNLATAKLDKLLLEKVKVTKTLFAGDTKAGAIVLHDSELEAFDCTNCRVDQYVTLTSKFTGDIRLNGAHIAGHLRFREGKKVASWTGKPVVDLTDIDVNTIAADYCNFVVSSEPNSCEGPLVQVMISGAKFQHVRPGYVPIFLADEVKKQSPDRKSLLDLPPARILDWIEAGSGGEFESHPYETIAAALDRSGRREAAKDIRIGKVDAELKNSGASIFKRGFYGLVRMLTDYGHRNEKSVWAFVLLVALGIAVFYVGHKASPWKARALQLNDPFAKFWYAVWFSIDRAVPPLAIDPSMHEYSLLTPGARAYFYLHRGLGTLIITIFIASITGAFL